MNKTVKPISFYFRYPSFCDEALHSTGVSRLALPSGFGGFKQQIVLRLRFGFRFGFEFGLEFFSNDQQHVQRYHHWSRLLSIGNFREFVFQKIWVDISNEIEQTVLELTNSVLHWQNLLQIAKFVCL